MTKNRGRERWSKKGSVRAATDRVGTKYKGLVNNTRAAQGLSTKNIGRASVNRYHHLDDEKLFD